MAKYTFNGKRILIYGKIQKEVKALLKQKLKEIEIVLEKGCTNYIKKIKITFGEWLYKWLEKYCKKSVKVSTYSWYKIFVRVHTKTILGNCKTCDLTTKNYRIYLI